MLRDPQNLLPHVDWRMRAMARSVARSFKRRTGRDLQVRSGLRSCAEQDRIYAQGRTTSGAIVTGASGCRSWHVAGLALDVDPVDPRTGKVEVNGDHPDYRTLGMLWKRAGGQWGGDFDLYDPGHIEWHPNTSINDVCPVGTTCSQFRVSQQMPLWLWASAGVLSVGLGCSLVWAFRS